MEHLYCVQWDPALCESALESEKIDACQICPANFAQPSASVQCTRQLKAKLFGRKAFFCIRQFQCHVTIMQIN